MQAIVWVLVSASLVLSQEDPSMTASVYATYATEAACERERKEVGEYSLAKIKEFEAEDKVKAGANLGAVCIKVPMNLYQSKVKPAKGV